MIRILTITAFTVAAHFIAVQHANAQETADLQQKIRSKDYVFEARTANPMRGGSIQLTYGYDLRVSPDSIVAYLPYFGRAFTAPVNPSEGGIKFSSVNFEYVARSRKKNGWSITIKPKDVQDIQQLNLTISSDGSTVLQVSSTNRQPISFFGQVSGKR